MKQAQEKIRFATWNIDSSLKVEAHYAEAFEGWRMKNRVEEIAKFIEKISPDILHLQEVRKVKYKEELVNSLDHLKSFLEAKGYKVLLRSYDPSKGSSLEENSLTEGQFKYITAYRSAQFEELGTDLLPITNRCVFITKLKHIKTEQEIYTFNVHMDPESEANRIEGSKLIIEALERYLIEKPQLKIIIAGDFNSFSDANGEGQIRILTDFKSLDRSLVDLTTELLLPDQSEIPEGNTTFFYYPYDFNHKVASENLDASELRNQIREKFAREGRAKGGHLDHILIFNLKADSSPILEVSPQFEPFPLDYTEATLKDYIIINIGKGPAFLSDHQLTWVDLQLSGASSDMM